MKKHLLYGAVLVSLLLAASSVPQVWADVKLPKVIGDHMVLNQASRADLGLGRPR